jgi:hypothetical protein
LGLYLRLLFNVLRHIRSNNSINDQDKSDYAKSLRAYLSDAEIVLISLNAISDNAREMVSPVNDFHMLRHMDPASRRNFALIEETLGSTAFED